MEKDVLDAQHPYWEKTFSEKPDMFGIEPSDPARKAAEIFKKEGKAKILELGSGQGRDTLFLARNGFQKPSPAHNQNPPAPLPADEPMA